VTISRAQKTKMLGDAGMEKMYFRQRNRTTDVKANCAPLNEVQGFLELFSFFDRSPVI